MVEVGVDIGGTFTDVVCRVSGQPLKARKVASTPDDPSKAVLKAVSELQTDAGVRPADIQRFVHGTTVATNAVLERKGPKTGILTTEGFRDVLEIGRQMRHQLYQSILHPEVPSYLAPGAYRQEVQERLAADGNIVRPLDEGSVQRAADQLVEQGVESIAICFLFSFVNPENERRAAEIVRDRHPHVAISLSSSVDPAFREYERTVVTTFDAYIKPVVDRYLENLENGLAELGVPCPLQVMQSRGGIASSVVVRERPVRLFLSGPAAGVVGAQMTGGSVDINNLISVDIGGTSTDISLIRDGEPMIRPDGKVGGYTVRVPMVDVNAIGSGGGSIAWIDPAGGLRVGPHSAGSDPGPACYGRGGKNATVTDASLVLGYLDPAYFAGGTLALDADRAATAIQDEIAEPLGMSVEQAALGIHEVLNAQMTEGIRLVSIQQGYDPREFALMPLGGAGGLHACALATELGIDRILVARHPGVLSATGLLSAVIEHDAATAFPHRTDAFSMTELETCLRDLDTACASRMREEGVTSEDAVDVQYVADVCYVGQSHYLQVPFTLGSDTADQLRSGFQATHRRVFGHATDAPTALVNVRSIHRAGGDTIMDLAPDTSAHRVASKGQRDIVVPGVEGRTAAEVYDRESLPPNTQIPGPAILEQSDTTILVAPGWSATALEGGNILIARNGAA